MSIRSSMSEKNVLLAQYDRRWFVQFCRHKTKSFSWNQVNHFRLEYLLENKEIALESYIIVFTKN